MNDQSPHRAAECPDGDFEIDPDGLIKRVDQHACILLGSTENDLLGRPLQHILASGQEDLIADDRQRMSDSTVLRTEWRLRRADGSEFSAEVVARGLGKLAMRFIARDATDVKAADVVQARLAAIVESSDDAIISKTLSGIVTSWNASAERIFGYSANEMIGRSIRRLIPQDRASEEDDFLARIACGEHVQNFETVRRRKDGSLAFISVTVSPIRSESGAIIGASKIARDISAAQLAKAQLRDSEERFRALADNISQLAWMADSNGWIFWYNRRWYEYTGTTLDEMQGWGWQAVHHPDHIGRVVERIQQCWDSGEPWEDTFPLRGVDGQYRWFLSRAQPIRDDQGSIVRWCGTNTDITEQKQREEQIRLLMREVNHRSKNMLALVQAIVRQTAAADTETFISHFQERIQALSSSQDLLVRSGWRGASIVDLVKSQLAHFKDLIGGRIRLQGPDVVVTTNAAQAIGMALHELGTNAGKYGALSNDSGHVEVRWHETGEGDETRFHVRWQEFDGPPVEPPQRSGFGSVVVEKMVGVSLGASSELEFLPVGVCWTLAGPSSKVVAERPRVPSPDRMEGFAPSSGGLRVLIVDDDTRRAMSLVEQLQSANHQAIGPVGTIEEAFARIGDDELDCVVLGSDVDADTAGALLNRLAELSIPYFSPAVDQQRDEGNRDSVDDASTMPGTRELVSSIERVCIRARSR